MTEKWIFHTVNILMNCRTIKNSVLAAKLNANPEELSQALWASKHPNIDFCPTSSKDEDIVWEWRFPDDCHS